MLDFSRRGIGMSINVVARPILLPEEREPDPLESIGSFPSAARAEADNA